MANTTLPGYPAPPGNKPHSIIDHTGPTSYTQITAGTVTAGPTGGDKVLASDFGLSALEIVDAMSSDSGTYDVIVYKAPPQTGQPVAAVILQWITAATGAEVAGTTNLSTENVRLRAIGLL